LKEELFLGIDIGGTKCALILGNGRGKIFAKKKFPTVRGNYQLVVRDIVESVGDILKESAFSRDRISSVGVSCGGPLDPLKGLILSPPNLPGWDRVPITEILHDELKIPVYLQNDADAGALAEWTWGAGKGCKNMIFLTFGTGIGAGLILNGKLYRGSNGTAGEVGHIRLAEEGPNGYGKNGSFEGFCSGGGIASLAAMKAEELSRTGLSPSSGLTAREIGEAAETGNPAAKDILAVSGKYLGRGLSILIDILNPEVIVIGSIFIRCEKFLRPSMEEEIRKETLMRSSAVCRILPAALGERIGDYAALGVAVDASKLVDETASC
jgi:glucokinase